MRGFDRRFLMQGAAAAALTAAATSAFAQSSPNKLLNRNVLLLRTQPVLRRSVNTMALTDPALVSYRKAVAAMKALPASDPRNWTKQAQIHNNFCPHRNWFFLPWHRAYLVAFERLCRQLSGDANFALPYWDWTANAQLPAAFASPTFNGQPNPLFDANRSSQTATVPATYVGPAKMTSVYAETSFEIFGSTRPTGQNNTAASWQRVGGVEGPFESGPHDHVHITISGDMGTFMSPLDPVFWLHHCNIDRVWDHWNGMGRVNSSDNLWRTFAFNGQFVNPSGANSTTAYNTTVAGVLDIGALGYRYTLPLVSVLNVAVLAKLIDINKPKIVIKIGAVAPAKLNLATSAKAQLTAPQALVLTNTRVSNSNFAKTAKLAAPAQAPGRVLAFIRDAEKSADGNVDVRVFINHPDPNPETSVQDRHYAGAFTFFGAEHAAHG
ncbi:MAG: tyrosinase family protein, partial [Pseudolabrys sp.]